MFGHVWTCLDMFGHVWTCLEMFGKKDALLLGFTLFQIFIKLSDYLTPGRKEFYFTEISKERFIKPPPIPPPPPLFQYILKC